jgi:hypothetical protein
MYLDKLSLIVIVGALLYIFFQISKELEKLSDRVYDLEHSDEELDENN